MTTAEYPSFRFSHAAGRPHARRLLSIPIQPSCFPDFPNLTAKDKHLRLLPSGQLRFASLPERLALSSDRQAGSGAPASHIGQACSVQCITLDELQANRWDPLAAQTRGIDPWCSMLAWQQSVNIAFDHDEERFRPIDATTPNDVVVDTDDFAFALRGRTLLDHTPALLPLDAVWAFASPVVCTDNATDNAADSFAEHLAQRTDWQFAYIPGIQANSVLDSAIIHALSRRFAKSARLLAGDETVRCVATLANGFDGFLAIRTREFRRNIRQSQTRAKSRGVVVSTHDIDPTLPIDDQCNGVMQRMLDIEHRSWKGKTNSGILGDGMQTLYRHLLRKLPPESIRFSVASIGEQPIGFVLGAVRNGTYRGLQISFDDEYRELSIGSLLQIHEVMRLCNERVLRYDLGMDMEYKQRWAEDRFITRPILILRK
jgi:hypothetical protein